VSREILADYRQALEITHVLPHNVRVVATRRRISLASAARDL